MLKLSCDWHSILIFSDFALLAYVDTNHKKKLKTYAENTEIINWKINAKQVY